MILNDAVPLRTALVVLELWSEVSWGTIDETRRTSPELSCMKYRNRTTRQVLELLTTYLTYQGASSARLGTTHSES